MNETQYFYHHQLFQLEKIVAVLKDFFPKFSKNH